MLKRFASGLTLGAVIFSANLYFPAFVVFVAVALGLALHELVQINKSPSGYKVELSSCWGVGLVLLINAIWHTSLTASIWPLYLAAIISFILLLDYLEGNRAPLWQTLFGYSQAMYLIIPICFLVMMRQGQMTTGNGHPLPGHLLVLSVLILNCTSDIMSLFIGKYFGRRKLCPKISPSKTVVGFLAGIAFTLVAAFVIRHWLGYHTLAFGLIIAVTAPVGDLIESAWKRRLSIKDSSSLIPGHGGVLDRLDSLMLSTTVIFIYLQVSGSLSF